MPLAGPSVQNFVQNRESANTNGHLPTRSSTPQPQQQRERSRQRTVQDRRQARSNSQNGLHSRETLQNLKVEVPNTLRKTVSSIPQTLVANTGRRSNAHASARPQKSRLAETSAFDDTQSIHFDDSTSLVDDETQMPLCSGQYNDRKLSPDPAMVPPLGPFNRTQAAISPAPHDPNRAIAFLPKDWKAKVDKERILQQEKGRDEIYYAQRVLESDYIQQEYDDGYDEDSEYAEKEHEPWTDTPSRSRPGHDIEAASGPLKDTVKKHTRAVVAEDPLSPPLPPLKEEKDKVNETHSAGIQAPMPLINRFKFHQTQAENDSIESANLSTTTTIPELKPRSSNPPFSSKVSSYHESSSEEDQPADTQSSKSATPSGMKRPHQTLELDYDPATLMSKTFAELDQIPFSLDPCAAPQQPVLDTHGNAMTLPARLTNLTKMRQEDQAILFRSQTDTEREETTEWFLTKFREEMHKLMRVRIERRKVALRFEIEVKMREKRVAIKKSDVEAELSSLRKGGDELIAGRTRN